METRLSLLKRLGLSDAESRIYLTLVAHGALTASELTKLTHGKRPTVYYAIRQLLERGIIHKLGAPGVERFQAQPADKLLTLITLRQQELEALTKEVKTALPSLVPNKVPHEGKPVVQFYEGKEAMKQAVMETLYCRGRHIDSIAPSDNFFWQIGQAFSASYIAERVARKITTRNLWEKPLEPEILLRSYKGLSEVRLLPKPMHDAFRTTVFLYDDTVMYISSLKTGYVLVVKSREHHELMLATYNALWETSKPVTIG